MRYSKLQYYFFFLYYKICIFTDTKSGRWRLYFSEFLHIWNFIFHTSHEMPGSDQIRTIETIFGKYKFIGDYYGYSILSPAFERPDKELLIDLMRRSLNQNKNVLYLDVGAFVGDYTIGVQKFVNAKRLTTLAFEPDIDYYKLLLVNANTNHVTNYKAYNVGLSNSNKTIEALRFPTLRDAIHYKKLKFRLRRLDDILPASFYKKFDEIFIKIDIEGHEEETFEGAIKLMKSGKKIYLMIEDCVNPLIVRYLTDHGFRFVQKITPYDSFWEMN